MSRVSELELTSTDDHQLAASPPTGHPSNLTTFDIVVAAAVIVWLPQPYLSADGAVLDTINACPHLCCGSRRCSLTTFAAVDTALLPLPAQLTFPRLHHCRLPIFHRRRN